MLSLPENGQDEKKERKKDEGGKNWSERAKSIGRREKAEGKGERN